MRERSPRPRTEMMGFTPRQQLGLVILLGIILLPRLIVALPESRPSEVPVSNRSGKGGIETGPGRLDTATLEQGRLFLLGHRLDLNLATAQELTLLPLIGPKRAKIILEKRSGVHGFRSLDELLEIPGIGPVLVEGLRPLVSCGSRAAP